MMNTPYKPVSLDEMKARFSPADRKLAEQQAAELIAEERTLRDLRKAMGLTQEHMAQVLKIGQENVSRIEKRSDLLISTLRGFVEAMGGHLNLVAEFPDRPPVRLRTLADVGEKTAPSRRRASRGKLAV
jgi:DNA-binding XRE family transcriptional regulator